MTIPWPDPDPATLQALGRVAWAAAVVDSCVLKACRNLSARVDVDGRSTGAWLREARKVLKSAPDPDRAQVVVQWLIGVERALDERHQVLHGHPAPVEWFNGDDPPVPGGMGLANRAHQTVVLLEPVELNAVADRMLASLAGWEQVHGVALALRALDG